MNRYEGKSPISVQRRRAAVLGICAAAGGVLCACPAAAEVPGDTSGPCGDLWINSAYHQIAGRAPFGSGKSVGECNVNRYGGGRWSTYDDLYAKVRTYLRIESRIEVACLIAFGRLPDEALLDSYSQQPERSVAGYLSDFKVIAFYNSAERANTIDRAYLAATGRHAGPNDQRYYANKRDAVTYVDLVKEITAVLWSEANNENSEKVKVIRAAYAAANLKPTNNDIYGVGGLIGGWVHGEPKSYVRMVAENLKWGAEHFPRSTPTALSIPMPSALASEVSSALGFSAASIVAQGGLNIVAQGGLNLVNTNGSNIVAQGGLNIVAQGGGNFFPSKAFP